MDISATQKRDEGAALVEFAVVATLLFMLLFGIIEFGRAYSMQVQLTNAVREGARAAALGKTSAQVQSTVSGSVSGVTGLQTAVSVCAAAGGGNATVTSTALWSYSIPVFGTGSRTLTATGVMRCGG